MPQHSLVQHLVKALAQSLWQTLAVLEMKAGWQTAQLTLTLLAAHILMMPVPLVWHSVSYGLNSCHWLDGTLLGIGWVGISCIAISPISGQQSLVLLSFQLVFIGPPRIYKIRPVNKCFGCTWINWQAPLYQLKTKENGLFRCVLVLNTHNSFITYSPVLCQNGDIRLVNGTNLYDGRVEICWNETWGTVCDGFWSTFDATVACRQLGFISVGTCRC